MSTSISQEWKGEEQGVGIIYCPFEKKNQSTYPKMLGAGVDDTYCEVL